MERRISLLKLVTGLGVGGAERVILNLVRELRSKEDVTVTIVSITDLSTLAEEFDSVGIKVLYLNAKRTPISIILSLVKLLKIIKREQINLIHAHMAHSLFYASFAKICFPKLKIVYTSHNFNIGGKIRELASFFLRPLRNMDIIFSEKMRSYIYRNDCVVIPNGVKCAEYDLDVGKNQIFTYLAVGRLEEVKNHKALIFAARKMKEVGMKFQILIAGDSYLFNFLNSLISKLDVQDVVKMLGTRSDIAKLCNQAHVFVLPSLWEGFPISLLEAGASGIPIISTRVGSVPEIMDNETGYLVYEDQLDEAMMEVYAQYNLASSKGLAFQKVVRNKYEVRHIADLHYALYKSL